MAKIAVVTTLAFSYLDRKSAVLAGEGVIDSQRYIDDPIHISVPALISGDIFIQYSFDDGPLKLYRLKRIKMADCSKYQYTVSLSKGIRSFNVTKAIGEYLTNPNIFGNSFLFALGKEMSRQDSNLNADLFGKELASGLDSSGYYIGGIDR